MVTGHPTATSAFPPIADYGFLSDCETATLIGADGSVEWLGVPRFDSPSVFAALLDRGAGHFRFGPARLRAPIARRYLPGTNVIGSDWMGGDGWLAVRDAMIVVPDPDDPADCRSRRMLVRVARCLEGKAHVSLACSPRFGYGLSAGEWSVDAAGGAVVSADGVVLRLTTDLDLERAGVDLVASRELAEGERCFCCLAWGEEDPPADAAEAWESIEVTARFWRGWVQSGRFPDHEWTGHLQRSALALKGLTYAPTGALVAAATTSLPETPGGERNWDYRYTWIRDATFALWALHAIGFDHEARDFAEFIAGLFAAAGPDPQIMFGIGGERDLPERTLDHLSGYGGARPVRIGNAAVEQRQNDVYGAFVDSIYVHSKVRDGLPEGMWPVARDQVEGALAVWREPDQGIWEARGEPRHYVSSKLMAWVALDRGVRLARSHGEQDRAERWAAAADEIRSEILSRGVSERGAFRQHYDTDALDASTLLVPLVRFLPHDDPRVRTTVLAIAGELTENGLVLRYRPQEVDDGVSDEPEGSFTICSFWLVSALSEIGERRHARELCARLLSLAGPLGLYAEEIDARSGEHLGNFPQAFTHLGLINAVSHVIAAELAGARDGPSAVFTEVRMRSFSSESSM
jgi:GH15 family glucan-1,4-alpha-glucosidase